MTDPTAKAELLNNQFKSVFTAPTPEADHDLPTDTTQMPVFTIRRGVLAQLKTLNLYKATGPDDISPRLLKELAETLADPLTDFFQKSLTRSEVPQDWEMARVTPLFKKGDRYMASNYRPISLTCVTCKVLEHIVTSQLTRFLENNNKLNKYQHGFRSKRSCESQLTEMVCDISKMMDDGQEVDAIFLDFSKAFDKVDHVNLIQKLKKIGANDQTTNWIKSLLHGRTQTVVADGHSSSPCEVTSGVPQGSVVGPILFLVYINDLPDSVTSTSRLFADDTLIYSAREHHHQLQKDVAALEAREAEWKVEFNPLKCEFVKFTRKKNTLQTTFTLHHTQIPKADSVK